MTHKTKRYGITKHRHDGHYYFATSHAEHQQFLEMVLDDIKPEECSWTIQPLKHDPKGYDLQIMGTGNTLFVVTSHQEWEQVMDVVGGHLEVEKCVLTIPPYRYIASYIDEKKRWVDA